MTNENEASMFVAKIMSVTRKKREELLTLMYYNINRKDEIIEFLDYKKAYSKTKKLGDGDKFWVTLNFGSYPNLNQDYYKEKNLINDNQEVLVKLDYINPFTGYFAIRAFWGNNSYETVNEVYEGNIPAQENLLDL